MGGCEYLSRTDKLNAQLGEAHSLVATAKEIAEARRLEWTQLKSAREKLDAALKRVNAALQQREELDQKQRKLEGEIKYLATSMSNMVAQIRLAAIGSVIKELRLPERSLLLNAKVLKIGDDSISFLHEDGVANLRVRTDQLPKDLIQKYDLDPNSTSKQLRHLEGELGSYSVSFQNQQTQALLSVNDHTSKEPPATAMAASASTIQVLPNFFRTTNGIDIRNAKIINSTEDSIRIMHDGGIVRLNAKELPQEIAGILGFRNEGANDEAILPDPLITSKHRFAHSKLTGIDPDGIRILHAAGVAKINYEDLSKDLIAAFGPFEADRAKIFRDQQQELQRAAYSSAQKLKMAGGKAVGQPTLQIEDQKQKLLANPSLISTPVIVELTGQSVGGKIKTSYFDPKDSTSTREESSARNIMCHVQSKSDGYQRLRLQCLMLSRPAFVKGDIQAEVVGETMVELGPWPSPGFLKIVTVAAEAVKTEKNRTIARGETANFYITISLRTRSGVKYIGWCWRAIDGLGRICAVSSSIPPYDRFAWRTPL